MKQTTSFLKAFEIYSLGLKIQYNKTIHEDRDSLKDLHMTPQLSYSHSNSTSVRFSEEIRGTESLKSIIGKKLDVIEENKKD